MNIFIIIIFAIIFWLNMHDTPKYLESFNTHEISPHTARAMSQIAKRLWHMYLVVLDNHNMDIDVIPQKLNPPYKLYSHPDGLVIGREDQYNNMYNDIYIKVICPTQIKDKYRSIAIKNKVKYYSINCYKQI
uniref:Uncharacterized protein n=1 Tax=Mimivirus LCMiAC02 TaxID=2506609 RepID=A0A481Z2Q1_9VIRU|nr:MAG: hypothetical protein LCMiAC02_01370 [Mimivirus LCMiAC02]